VLERLSIAIILFVLGWAAYTVMNRALLRRRAGEELGLEGLAPGRPAILYFTAPGCLPCHTIQRPALAQLSEAYGERLQVLEVDAVERPGLADHWGVLSLPTTFIIDRRGRPRGVNHGAVRAAELLRQLEAIGETPAQSASAPTLAPN
jgi:thiol-disulfide isomerase/thioredoxin